MLTIWFEVFVIFLVGGCLAGWFGSMFDFKRLNVSIGKGFSDLAFRCGFKK